LKGKASESLENFVPLHCQKKDGILRPGQPKFVFRPDRIYGLPRAQRSEKRKVKSEKGEVDHLTMKIINVSIKGGKNYGIESESCREEVEVYEGRERSRCMAIRDGS
jgi:hypothetical protein